jgi:DNA polymerase-3 subunit delta'
VILGHQKQWQFLENSARQNKIPQAILFFGKDQLGKKTLAREFVKFLNCQNIKKPCQICRSCQDIQKNQFPDLMIVEPIKKEIQISQIRELLWKLSLKPYLSFLKTAIINEAHLMTKEAQAAFLKTLEEPKGKSLIILISQHPQMLSPTILSRLEKLRFSPLSFFEIENYLKKEGVSEKRAKEIVKFSLGRPGKAIEFLKNPAKLDFQKEKISDLIKIFESDLSFRFQYAKNLAKDFQNLKETLEIWQNHLRDILLLKLNINSLNQLEVEYYGDRNYFPPLKYSVLKLKEILKNLEKIYFLILNTNVNFRLALEILMLKL